MPTQKPGRSKQDYSTPKNFIDAVENLFGVLDWDLACDGTNNKAPQFFTENENSLAQDWTKLKGNLWLNPPFGKIAPWAKKCYLSKGAGRRILLLTPASIGSNWFQDYVYEKALTIFALNPRLSFDGKAPFPKDCCLIVYAEKDDEYGMGNVSGFKIWKWNQY